MSETIHNLGPMPAFVDQKPDTPISEFALRVIVECPGWNFYVVGTATLITGHLAITAKHVLEHVVNTFGLKASSPTQAIVDNYELKLLQLLPGPVYRFWNVYTAWPTSSDIALLHLGIDRTSDSNESIEWKMPRLRVMAPPADEAVVCFGYRESKIQVTETADGTHHIELNDRPTTSIGRIRRVYPSGRDTVMLPFPCFEVEARFDPGMSGGMVIDQSGSLCGLICASLQYPDSATLPISYVATLWPMLKTKISINRGEKYPRDVTYPVLDLALDRLISVTDLDKLDPQEFPPVAGLPTPTTTSDTEQAMSDESTPQTKKVRYFHGGNRGLSVGDYILPPAETKVWSASDYTDMGGRHRKDRVYVTTNLSDAETYAAGNHMPIVYVVEPDGDVEDDPDFPHPGRSFCCKKARIIAISKVPGKSIKKARKKFSRAKSKN